MTDWNKRKAEQLGIPFGTATNRLRKMVLFRLLQRLDEDVCSRCGKRIMGADDLSMEHKKPWLGKDTALFWDIDNVSFSHLSCNSGAPNREKQTCHRGHSLADAIVDSRGSRNCRTCKRERQHELYRTEQYRMIRKTYLSRGGSGIGMVSKTI